MLASLLYLFLLCGLLGAVELPGGIKACKNDNKLNECAARVAKDAIKNIVKGDPKLHIPVIDPLYVERIALTDSPGRSVSLNLTFDKLNIHGLRNSEFVKTVMDTKKMHLSWSFKVKELKFVSKYEINGKFLLVPITGQGDALVMIYEPLFTYNLDYKLVDRKGKKYMAIGKPTLTYTPKKITVKLENLFNGNKALGKTVNEMLNDNWKDLNEQLGPGIANAISTIVEDVLRKITNIIPYDKIFLPA